MCFFSDTVPDFCSFLKAVFPPTAAGAHPAVHEGKISLWVVSPEAFFFSFLMCWCCLRSYSLLLTCEALWEILLELTFDASSDIFFFEPSTLQHPTKIVTDLFIVLLWAKIQEANITSSNPLSRIIPCFLLSKFPLWRTQLQQSDFPNLSVETSPELIRFEWRQKSWKTGHRCSIPFPM